MRTVKDVLVAARARIAEPTRWMKGDFGTDEHGSIISSSPTQSLNTRLAEEGKCYCAYGAVCAELPGPMESEQWRLETGAMKILDDVARGFAFAEIVDMNDDPRTTHDDILAAFDEAIRRCE